MFKKILKICLITFFSGVITACSSAEYHEYIMNGTIVSIGGTDVVVCVGSEEGAEPGMIMDVYEVEYTGSMEDGTDNYALKDTGDIRIESIINKHFARGVIIGGAVEPNNIAKLREK